MLEIEPDSELDREAKAFLAAGRRYHNAIKRLAPKELGGVIWLQQGSEAVFYSENERYSRQVKTIAFDRARDEIVFTEAIDDEE